MHGDQQAAGLVPILLITLDGSCIGSELGNQGLSTRGIQCAAAAREQEILGAVFFVDLVFVRQIVADGGDVEVAGFDQSLDGLHHWRLERSLPVLVEPGRFLFKICGIVGELGDGRGHWLVGDGNEALRTSLRPAGIAINLDETVVEIDGRIILYPGNSKRNPFGVVAGLVITDEMADGFGLLRIGVGARFLQAIVRLL